MDEKVRFKYYKPIIKIIADIVWLVIIASSAYFLLNNVIFPTAIKILFGIFVLRIIFEHFIGNNIIDLSGMFILRNNNFDILAIKNAKNIYYIEIVEIKREFYERSVSLICTSASQANPGKYTICLKNGKQYSFCVSAKEEKVYDNKIKKLNKKIYKTNALGVHFNTKRFRERMDNKENEMRFELETPNDNFSLKNAIIKLLGKSGIKLNDLTKE